MIYLYSIHRYPPPPLDLAQPCRIFSGDLGHSGHVSRTTGSSEKKGRNDWVGRRQGRTSQPFSRLIPVVANEVILEANGWWSSVYLHDEKKATKSGSGTNSLPNSVARTPCRLAVVLTFLPRSRGALRSDHLRRSIERMAYGVCHNAFDRCDLLAARHQANLTKVVQAYYAGQSAFPYRLIRWHHLTTAVFRPARPTANDQLDPPEPVFASNRTHSRQFRRHTM